jgi:hypothetical protein
MEVLMLELDAQLQHQLGTIQYTSTCLRLITCVAAAAMAGLMPELDAQLQHQSGAIETFTTT